MIDEKRPVARSKRLIESKFPGWDAGTLNIFDTYLSRINPKKPESSEVIFTKREYEELIGLKEIRVETLNNYLRKFIGNTVSLPLEKGGWDNYALFDRARLAKNSAGVWEITLRCHPELRQLFFDLKESGYQSYRLEYALKLKHKPTKLLYYILKDKQYMGEWTVELKELRERLGVSDKSYEKFKEFNRTILQRAEKEINEFTDLKFTYEKIQKGGLTRAVVFHIEKPKKRKVKKVVDQEQISGQLDFSEAPTTNTRTPEEQAAFNHCKELLQGYKFTDEQVDKLMELSENLVPKHFTADGSPACLYVGDIIQEKIEAVEEYRLTHVIDNNFRTFYSAVTGDWHPNHPVEKPMPDDFIFSEAPIFKENKE